MYDICMYVYLIWHLKTLSNLVFCPVFLIAERTLEDHESVLEVYKQHLTSTNGRLHLRKDFRKYEMFLNPGVREILFFLFSSIVIYLCTMLQLLY